MRYTLPDGPRPVRLSPWEARHERHSSVHRVREKSIIETYVPHLCNILARVLQEECLEDSQPYAYPCQDTPVALRRLQVLALLADA